MTSQTRVYTGDFYAFSAWRSLSSLSRHGRFSSPEKRLKIFAFSINLNLSSRAYMFCGLADKCVLILLYFYNIYSIERAPVEICSVWRKYAVE